MSVTLSVQIRAHKPINVATVRSFMVCLASVMTRTHWNERRSYFPHLVRSMSAIALRNSSAATFIMAAWIVGRGSTPLC